MYSSGENQGRRLPAISFPTGHRFMGRGKRFLTRPREGAAMATPTATSGLAPVNGIELGYQVFGEGDPLILLHGGFGSVEMFGPNVDALAAGRQVIGVDLQPHGRSPAADRPMRFET